MTRDCQKAQGKKVLSSDETKAEHNIPHHHKHNMVVTASCCGDVSVWQFLGGF